MTSKNTPGVSNWNLRGKRQKTTLIIVGSLAVLAVVLIVSVAVMSNNKPSHDAGLQTGTQEKTKKKEAKPVEKVKMISFAGMTDEDIAKWCKESGLTCKKYLDYSNTIPKGQVMKQSEDAGSEVAKGMEVVYTRCNGKPVTKQEENALAKARNYSDVVHLSKKKIYRYLVEDDGFTAEEAKYAIDHMD